MKRMQHDFCESFLAVKRKVQGYRDGGSGVLLWALFACIGICGSRRGIPGLETVAVSPIVAACSLGPKKNNSYVRREMSQREGNKNTDISVCFILDGTSRTIYCFHSSILPGSYVVWCLKCNLLYGQE
ncbi:hypothetical protein L228DRAFT_57087 [Xylona heveae TC161]|uniref:Uncharacterized protein n=1 Tax=Xylona heveae (strain CBS 132557 / TC161) TaxID=1328760 RepID=A0A165IG85_XYLHT|nr:hypothetical protein L228DRAFT_57087 [Xylona heveae TC161]KZF24853.1 hypothetical protein L228DRAFT_57087 [Xylona heveae TC161]